MGFGVLVGDVGERWGCLVTVFAASEGTRGGGVGDMEELKEKQS